jgi:flagellar hook-associated protein 2
MVQAIDGIISNLDTTSIVNTIMSYEMRSINRMESQKVLKTNQMSVYNSINAKLVALKVQASQLSQASTFDSAQAKVSDESFVTATIKSKVSEGQYNITIDQLALNDQLASQGYNSEEAAIGTGTFTLQLGDASASVITIDSGNNTLSGLKDAINKANAGVSAAIISDGSSSNSFRLLLTGEKSGAESQISVTSSLSGGTSPDFATSSFDAPETLNWDSASTAAISLGASANYSGTSNKTYTFTVQGTGAQIVGSTEAITVNWTDGTDSGSIEIPADYTAGTEIVLTGDGSEGLTMSFGAGVLTAGDTFQVQTFSPTLQQAQDAKITMGNVAAGGSPITVTSSSNTVDDLIPGVSLNLKKVTDVDTPSIIINTSVNVSDIESKINSFIGAYNSAMTEIDNQFKYNQDTQEAGTLFGDYTLLSVQNRMRSTILTKLDDVDSEIRLLSQLGIRHSTLGELRVADSGTLRNAIENNLEDVLKFFSNSANSDNSKIIYQNANAKTNMPDTGFTVNITQAATQGYLKGTSIGDPSVGPITIDENNYKLKLRVDGLVSDDIALTQKTYNSWTELANEIQLKIDEDDKLGDKNLTVDFADVGDVGYLQIKSATYGSNSKVELQAGIANSAFTILGLAKATVVKGDNVQGTINGEDAEGTGQILVGKEDNTFSEGLSLKVTLDRADIRVGNGTASLTLVKGFGNQMDELLDMFSATGEGILASRTTALQLQIDSIGTSIEKEEARLKIREASLYKQYLALEDSLAQWNSISSTLESQFNNINNNWGFTRK